MEFMIFSDIRKRTTTTTAAENRWKIWSEKESKDSGNHMWAWVFSLAFSFLRIFIITFCSCLIRHFSSIFFRSYRDPLRCQWVGCRLHCLYMISKINSNASKCCCKTHEKAMTYRMQVIKGNVCIKASSLQLEIEHTCPTVCST